MERLGESLRRTLESLGPPAAIGPVVDAWAAAVGRQIAANAWPARIGRDGTLVVHARDSIWAFELTQRADEIRARLGIEALAKLKFVPGPLPEAGAEPPPEAAPAPPAPSPAVERAAAALVAEIEDANLREIVSKAATLSLSRAADGRPFW
jgi:hypothetical protein